MSLLGEIVIGILLTAAGLIVIALLVLWGRLGRRIRYLPHAFRKVPARIRLQPVAPTWHHPDTVHDWQTRFRDAGFVDIGTYRLPELADMGVWAGTHPDEHWVGVVYDHPLSGVLFDVVALYPDETVTTFARAPVLNERHIRPGDHKVARPDMTLDEALAGQRTRRRDTPPRAVDERNFTAAFEAAWARDIDWLHRQHGADDAFVRHEDR